LRMKKLKVTILLIFYPLVEIFAQIPEGYYDSAAGKAGTELKAALNTIVNTGLKLKTYGDARYILDESDQDPTNPGNIILVYLGTSVSSVWDAGVTWAREHVWPQSLLGEDAENNIANVCSDLHNLKPVEPGENSRRSNKYYDNQTTSASYAPRAEVRGDLSRILFYMVIAYEEDSLDLELVNHDPGMHEMAMLDVLLEWHTLDPIDDFERHRNEVIYSYQHNRNPFIDHPEYVALIWGSDLPPLAPSNLSAGTITQTSVTLTWSDNSLDETGFRIYQDDDSLTTTAANVTTFTVENLTPATRYVFTVTAVNQHGESSAANLELKTKSESTPIDSVFFSEYLEGSSYNKALEIVNASNDSVVLSDYAILSNYDNNNDSWNTTHYNFPSGTILAPGAVWVIANSSADQKIKTVADDTLASLSAGGVVNFNGNDVRALVKITESDTAIIDIIGLFNDPDLGDGWSVAGIPLATIDHTLIRKPGIRKGNPDWLSSAGSNSDDSEWLVLGKDTFDSIGTHTLGPINQNEIRITHAKPVTYRLYANYPNPFNQSTIIRYDLQQATTITLTIYDLKGAIVKTLVDEKQPAGTYSILWNGCNAENHPAAAGIYLYRFQTTAGFAQTGKMILLK